MALVITPSEPRGDYKPKIAKVISIMLKKLTEIPNAAEKFTASVVQGRRILPAKKFDFRYPIRLDAGYYLPPLCQLARQRRS